MEWSTSFSKISLSNLTATGQSVTGNSSATLITTGDVVITADNTYNAAQLQNTTGSSDDTLITKYKLTFDGDGVSDTGGTDDIDYIAWDSFLTPTGKEITHVLNDDEVVITLGVEASTPADEAPDAGNYTATQTLTASWAGL